MHTKCDAHRASRITNKTIVFGGRKREVLGLMQQQNLLLSSIIQYAARWHPRGEVVSRVSETDVYRTDYATVERRSRRLARVIERLGVHHGDRIATMAWNGYRH